MKHIFTLALMCAISGQPKAQSSDNAIALLTTNHTNTGSADKKDRAREALPELLRSVFTGRVMEEGILLTVDAGWRNDSLSIEYKYYKGNNLLTLDENQLVEKIYFTVDPSQIDIVETEVDEFTFLYLRNKRKTTNILKQVNHPARNTTEETKVSSMGFPVRSENLALVLQFLKDLR